MTLQGLRAEYTRLAHPKNIDDCIELIDIYCNFLITTIDKHRVHTSSVIEGEATLLFQMMMTKTLYIKSIIKGVSFTSKNEISLNNIIDPTVLAILIRNTYETVSIFNLIYRVNKKGDERTIVYSLWAIAGLKYRQRFENMISGQENAKKLQAEQESINYFISEILNTALYKNLDEINRGKIQNQIKKKEYFIRFDNNKVLTLHWQELCKTMGCDENYFESIYTYFSLYAHPSNVSVFQFGDMFHDKMEASLNMVNLNMQYFFMFLSIFISDYIILFPNVLKTFNNLELLDQLVINSYNTFERGYEYSINESWKELG